MNYINIIFKGLGPAISLYIMLLAFGKLNQNKQIVINLKNILIILFCGIIISLNTYTNDSLPRMIISLIVTMACFMFIYKENILKTFIYTLITYIFMAFYEILFSCIILAVKIINIDTFDKHIIIKTIFSILVTYLSFITCKIKIINTIVNKIINKLSKIQHIYIILFFALLSLMLIDTNGIMNFKLDEYINNVILVVCVSLIIVFGLYNYIKATKEMEKSEALLNFLKKYEKIIESDRENRHEILNNLLILKSIKNKNTKNYEDVLNNLITDYSKKGTYIKNIYKLPSGLKGIFYYKLNGLSEKEINFNINISKQFNLVEKKLSHIEYTSLCRILGIALDNAVEASITSKDKIINIEVYKEKKEYIICIDNSFTNKKVDLNKINNKYYSTKGKGRGIGLYLAKSLMKDLNRISMTQKINDNMFTTKIIIKEVKEKTSK